MKRDFSAQLKTIEGTPLTNGDRPFTLGTAAVEALLAPYQDEASLPGDQKALRYALALRIQNASKAIEVTIEELALLKALIGKAFAALIVGQAYPLLDADYGEPGPYDN